MELQPIFYYFEGSGFTGFPIEIGWAWLDGASVKSDSLLIRPMTSWDIDANWDAQAQSIHGISVTQLKEGAFPPPRSPSASIMRFGAGRSIPTAPSTSNGWASCSPPRKSPRDSSFTACPRPN